MRKRNRQKRQKRQAFTLMEVLLVAGILALLAALAVPKLLDMREAAVEDVAKSQVGRTGNIAKALDFYRTAMGRYPDTDDGLAALYQSKDDVDDERYKGPYMEGTIEELIDPWGSPYEYRSPGEFHEDGYDLWSTGNDKVDDEGKEGSDDIKNWREK